MVVTLELKHHWKSGADPQNLTGSFDCQFIITEFNKCFRSLVLSLGPKHCALSSHVYQNTLSSGGTNSSCFQTRKTTAKEVRRQKRDLWKYNAWTHRTCLLTCHTFCLGFIRDISALELEFIHLQPVFHIRQFVYGVSYHMHRFKALACQWFNGYTLR